MPYMFREHHNRIEFDRPVGLVHGTCFPPVGSPSLWSGDLDMSALSLSSEKRTCLLGPYNLCSGFLEMSNCWLNRNVRFEPFFLVFIEL